MDKGSAALTGAGTGAAVGTAIMPGIGTAVGAVGGAIGGWLLGSSSDDSGGGRPSYSPNSSNFQYGLGQFVDANGVVHPTPEERAQAEQQYQETLKALNEKRKAAYDRFNAVDPNDHSPEANQERGLAIKDRDAIDAQLAENDRTYNDANVNNVGQDTYAAQRTREMIGKQQALGALGQEAWDRDAPQQGQVYNAGQSYLSGADRASREQQLAALGGLQDFANRAQGPSAAQAQLQAGADMAARQQYGMARAQPGGGGAALRSAAFNVAGITGGAANNAAILRAQEDQAYRQQQLAALGAVQSGTGQLRAGDQSMAQAQANQANASAQQAIQVGANNLNANLQSRQQSDATTLGLIGQVQGYDAMRDAQARGQQSAGQAEEAANLQAAGLGSSNFNAAQQQSNTELAMGLGAASAGLSAYTASQQNAKPAAGPSPAQATASGGTPTSDIRAKKNIVPLDAKSFADGGYWEGDRSQPSAAPVVRQPDYAALDASRARELQALGAEGPNLRPARGFEFSYVDPKTDGAGRYVGPMAHNLEHLPGVVQQGPNGKKQIDASRLTLANTAAASVQQRRTDELQRRTDELQRQLEALTGAPSAPMPVPQRPDLAGLDAAYARGN